MDSLPEILAMEVLGNTIETYGMALLVLFGIYIIFRFLLSLLFEKLRKMAKKTKTDIDDQIVTILTHNRWIAFLLISIVYIDIAFRMPAVAEQIIDGTFNIIAVLLVIRLVNSIIVYIADKLADEKRNNAEQVSVQVIGKVIRGIVWILGALFVIAAFGYDISSLIAGLGIGGIAIALAVQNILGDLISSVSIYLDKPFRVGDYIIVGNQAGTVTNIGLKTTRIKSKTGEEIIISNKKLTETDINNYGRAKERRAEMLIGVTYDTPLKKMKKIPQGIEKIVESVPDTRFERAHFVSFGDSSKQFEIVFYVVTKDYITYRDRFEAVNFKIQEYFEKEKIHFAFPTQTVYVKK